MIKKTINNWSIDEKREAYKYLLKFDVMAFNYYPTFEEIVEAVLIVKNTTWEAVKSKCRKRPLSETRHIIYYFCQYYNLGLSLVNIGAPFNADHASVIYGIKKITDLIEFDKQVDNEIKEIINLLTKKSDV